MPTLLPLYDAILCGIKLDYWFPVKDIKWDFDFIYLKLQQKFCVNMKTLGWFSPCPQVYSYRTSKGSAIWRHCDNLQAVHKLTFIGQAKDLLNEDILIIYTMSTS